MNPSPSSPVFSLRIFLTFAGLGLSSLKLAAAAPVPASATAQGLDISESLQNILANTDGSDKYKYPTDLTRGIRPVPVHSHNDYWRDVPFYTALSAGCVSTEADVWLYNGTLYVGHEQAALTYSRTFASLYIDPIFDVLTRENPTSPFTTSPSTPHGVFDGYSDQILYLWVDVKNTGAETWPAVVEALQPLRDGGYLTKYDSENGTTPGAITVIGTGGTPQDLVAPLASRDYFWDAPLALLNTSDYADITADISPIASADFSEAIGTIEGVTFNDTQLATLRAQIKVASDRGIKARYWDQPAWPVRTRNAVWRILVDEGVGLLNTDDVVEAAGFGGINGYW